jgi:hypothetical protein
MQMQRADCKRRRRLAISYYAYAEAKGYAGVPLQMNCRWEVSGEYLQARLSLIPRAVT